MGAFLFLVALSPLFLDEYNFYLLNLVLVNLMGALGLNLLIGFTGLLSLGHAAFLGVGAYTCALLTTHLQAPLLVGIVCGGLVAAGFGLLVGIPSLRIKGFYLMVATLAFQFLIEYAIIHWESLTRGIRGIELPAPRLFGLSLGAHSLYFFFLFFFSAFFMWGLKNLGRSKFGRAFIAIRDHDVSAEIIGIPVFRYKLLAFAISSFYAGLAGALFAVLQRSAIPEDYTFLKSIEYLAMVLVGGLGSLLGTVFGVLFITLVPEFLNVTVSFLAKRYDPNLTVYLGPVKDLVFGLLIILFIIFKPEGLVRVWVRVRDYFRIWPLPYISQ
ncbi:MAG: branched-chain amino acid ABC transporter permease [Syntrophaceae bacterium]|nr:branched-chain amino acid ABC transporter permease [Syntrophaceae bacterium]